jgi:hypothetical protein
MSPARIRLWFALALAGAALAAGPARAQNGQELNVLHVLIVADTLDGNIGKSVARDAENVNGLLSGALPPDRCKITVLTGAQVKRQAILNHYAGLQAGANDGLLFYYAGHGGMISAANKEHILSLNSDPMKRAELIGAMKAKGTALMMVLTDCCSNYADRSYSGTRSLTKPPTFTRQTVEPGFRQLLFRARGVVDITAADDGTVAGGSNEGGGYFTQAFTTTLLSVRNDAEVSWSSFYPKLKKLTREKAATGGVPPDERLQSSRAFHLPGTSWGFVVDANLLVKEVQAGSPAERAGLRVGEKLLKIGSQNVQSRKECLDAVMRISGNTMQLAVRDAANMQVARTLQR